MAGPRTRPAARAIPLSPPPPDRRDISCTAPSRHDLSTSAADPAVREMGAPNEPLRRIPNGGRIIDQLADGVSSDGTFGVIEASECGRFAPVCLLGGAAYSAWCITARFRTGSTR